MWKILAWVLVVGSAVSWSFLVEAQERGRKPLRVEEIERLVQGQVSSIRIAEIIDKEGVTFEVTAEIRERLRKAGADDRVLNAVERASMETARRKLADQQKQIEDAQRRLEETQRKADDERKRKETEAKRQADEEKKQQATEARQRAEADREQKRQEARQRAEAENRQTGEMVRVPGGEFFMGCNEKADTECYDNEKPGRLFSVDAFQIDKTEVTVAQYGRCVDAGTCSSEGLTMPSWGTGNEPVRDRPEWAWACNWGKPGRESHPINCVEWRQAQGYCSWVGKRLPTEAEWEKAARGTDGRKYPWGNRGYGAAGLVANIADETAKRSHPDWKTAEGYDDGYVGTAPVGSFPAGASPYGALDMVGNVWEWTADWYDSEQTKRADRGGSWYSLPRFARASFRDWDPRGARFERLGFRCAR